MYLNVVLNGLKQNTSNGGSRASDVSNAKLIMINQSSCAYSIVSMVT
jgi:hypothetical protein